MPGYYIVFEPRNQLCYTLGVNKLMLKYLLLLLVIGLMAAGCQGVTLKKDYPSAPKEAYDQLPK
jgi:hypothetical protein